MNKPFIILLFALFATISIQAKDKDGVYIFGASISFSDSIVYFTEVQYLDSVKLDKKTRFLPSRQHYAYELKDFMSFNKKLPGRTSVIYFSKKESKLKKKVAKLNKRLINKQGKTVRYLGSQFNFTKP